MYDIRAPGSKTRLKLSQTPFVNMNFSIIVIECPSAGMFDSVGSTELQNAGKAGLVTVQGKISAVLGTVLICKSSVLTIITIIIEYTFKLLNYIYNAILKFTGAFLFITFFPEQAEKLLQLAPTG